MVAEDDTGIREAVQAMLEFAGYEVITSTDCRELLEMRANQPDLLLLDIKMCGTDGANICKQLKADKRTRGLPVIMVSATRDVETTARAAGADDFLAKPFEMDELLAKIAGNLSKIKR